MLVQINKMFWERLKNDDYITLFSPDVQNGELYDLFYKDPVKFKELYEMLEEEPFVRKKRIKASEIFNLFAQERTGTGRIYPMFIDNVNSATPYKEPIRQSNLCIEIALPTTPMGKKEKMLFKVKKSEVDKFKLMVATDQYNSLKY